MGQSIYETVKQHLIAVGWKIDNNVVENQSGELKEFLHPDTGKPMAWIDAMLAEQSREEQCGNSKTTA